MKAYFLKPITKPFLILHNNGTGGNVDPWFDQFDMFFLCFSGFSPGSPVSSVPSNNMLVPPWY